MSNENRGPNGVVGKSTAGDRVKARHASSGKAVSLRKFARALVKAGDQDATDWFASKAGALNLKRSEKNQTRVNLEKSMTKAAKSKKK